MAKRPKVVCPIFLKIVLLICWVNLGRLFDSIRIREALWKPPGVIALQNLKVIGDPNDDEYSDKEDCLNLHLSSMNIENILMENHEACAIGYVAGWVCSKLIHQECVDKLAAKKQNNPQVNLENTHIEMKSYQNANLLYPFKNTLEFAKNVTCLFNLNIESLLLKNKTGVRTEIIKIVDLVCKPLNLSLQRLQWKWSTFSTGLSRLVFEVVITVRLHFMPVRATKIDQNTHTGSFAGISTPGA
ncbi:hypothetical protein AGLY_014083 [Aphis glycines]|uniref:Uncharacterized protein n=1 Tax=Aphis glycines TaxID=307491 RepID=A0A6G0T4X9_APHGL|nr:hypothetical protein AGLY_014083 [Aphis glycines]